MNTEIKDIIDELILFRKTRKPIRHLYNAHNKIGGSEFVHLIGWLLLWHKEVFLELAKPEALQIDNVLHKQYLVFFKECPALEKIFTLHEDHIGWSEDVSEESQKEIRKYVHENYKVQIRIRKDRRLRK